MSTLTEADLAYLHSELGADADEDELQERYDRLGNLPSVAEEALRQRLADLVAEGPGISIPGVFSEQGKGDFIKALQAQLERLHGMAQAAAVAGDTGRLVRPGWGR